MSRYAAFYECYVTGQIGAADMDRLMRADAVFAAYVKREDAARMKRRGVS